MHLQPHTNQKPLALQDAANGDGFSGAKRLFTMLSYRFVRLYLRDNRPIQLYAFPDEQSLEVAKMLLRIAYLTRS